MSRVGMSPAIGRGILMSRFGSGIRQHGTHRALTGRAEPGNARLALDAIIVPGSRPAAYLDHAVTLARVADCWLLILCSQRLHRSEAEEFLAARSFHKAIVIDLPRGYSHELLEFPNLRSIRAELPLECGFFVTDLSMKRNLGLIIARMLRWRRVFFLDDDIRDVAHADLQATVDMLGSFSAAGMWVTDFPDNSIVCHANRTAAGPQDVFVSGAALAVDCDRDIGFFPDIYNEDWLFFFDHAADKRLANSSLRATQLTYYPFANPRRAAWQEFGDVLAEGLYALLHLGRNVEHATPEYWSYFLEARRNFLEGILSRSQNAHSDMRDEMVASVQAALKCLFQIKPELCARYVQSWRNDLNHWKWRMSSIPVTPSIEEALAELRLASAQPASSPRKVLPHWDEAKPAEAEPAVVAGAVTIPQYDTLRQISEHANVRLLTAAAPRAELGDTKPIPAVTDEDMATGATGGANDGGTLSSPDEARGRHRKSRGSWREFIPGVGRSAHRASAEVSSPGDATGPGGSGEPAEPPPMSPRAAGELARS